MASTAQTQTQMKKHLVSESLVSEMRRVDESDPQKPSTALCIVEGPCMEFGRVNQNNRIYPRKLIEDRIINYKPVQEAIKNKCMLGEGGHPETRIDISYPEVALCVLKIWIPDDSDHLVFGRFAILDTPVGRILKTLIDFGSKIGISARALAESHMENGTEIMSETEYDLITYDAVPDPGFKCAHLEKVKESFSRTPLSSMPTSELKNSVAALNALKIPAFESRMKEMTKELERRTDDEVVTAVCESLSDRSRKTKIRRMTTGRFDEKSSRRMSVSEILSSQNRDGAEAHTVSVKNESASACPATANVLPSDDDLAVRLSRTEAELVQYKEKAERMKDEIASLRSQIDAERRTCESLRHGIEKGLYQARYLEKYSELVCRADELSGRIGSLQKRSEGIVRALGKTLSNESKIESPRPKTMLLVNESRSVRRSVDEILSETKPSARPSNAVTRRDSVNVNECLERWREKAQSKGIKAERAERLVRNSSVQSVYDADMNNASDTVRTRRERALERRVNSISNFERDVHDIAPKRGMFLTGKRK